MFALKDQLATTHLTYVLAMHWYPCYNYCTVGIYCESLSFVISNALGKTKVSTHYLAPYILYVSPVVDTIYLKIANISSECKIMIFTNVSFYNKFLLDSILKL